MASNSIFPLGLIEGWLAIDTTALCQKAAIERSTLLPSCQAGDVLTALTQEQLFDEFCRTICDLPDAARCPARVNPTTTSRP